MSEEVCEDVRKRGSMRGSEEACSAPPSALCLSVDALMRKAVRSRSRLLKPRGSLDGLSSMASPVPASFLPANAAAATGAAGGRVLGRRTRSRMLSFWLERQEVEGFCSGGAGGPGPGQHLAAGSQVHSG